MEDQLPEGRYLVVGLGITGQAVIRFLVAQGVSCLGYEELSQENFQKARQEFEKSGVEFFFKKLPTKVFDNCREVFISPGVPLTRPWIQEAQKREIPVSAELELASRFLQGTVVAVTGTNGKSTTVSLLQAILKTGGVKSSLKGNIGSPLITAVAEPPRDYYVVEVSSFQLESIHQFHPKISVLLNVTADHLDRYSGLDDYAEAKARIFINQSSDDYIIYNADDLYCCRMVQHAKAQRIPFSLIQSQERGGFIQGNSLVTQIDKRKNTYSLSEASLRGLHNQENMLAAVLAATLLNVSSDVIFETLQNFKSLPHRLELVGTFRNVDYYDDSKGTNVGSVVMSLASFEKGVILILGGLNKKGDFSSLRSLVDHKAKAVILMGAARDEIDATLGCKKPRYLVETMEKAVGKAFELAKPGDVVLLSPACASFDQYKNYSERGDDFKKWVQFYGKEITSSD